jgi:hypothetical protein
LAVVFEKYKKHDIMDIALIFASFHLFAIKGIISVGFLLTCQMGRNKKNRKQQKS